MLLSACALWAIPNHDEFGRDFCLNSFKNINDIADALDFAEIGYMGNNPLAMGRQLYLMIAFASKKSLAVYKIRHDLNGSFDIK